MNGQQILSDVATKAMETFHRNSDTMVAGFLVRHPDVDPADVELVCRVTAGVFTFRIEPKELHVPAQLFSNSDGIPAIYMDNAQAICAYLDGWNNCRAVMLESARTVKDLDGTIVTLLKDSMPTDRTTGMPLELGLPYTGEAHG